MINKLNNIIKYFFVVFICLFLSYLYSCSNSTDSIKKPIENTDPEEPEDNSTTFRNPLSNTSAPDPWVFKDEDTYYVTYTTGVNITLVKTNKMSQINKAVPRVVWTPPSVGLNSQQIWAPEIHKINDVWYIYYAASNGDNSTHRMWVLENKSSDPLKGTWVDKGELSLPDDKWAIDGSPFELNGELYFVWSGWEGDSDGRQDIYITKMIDPLTATGDRFLLIKPEEEWEINNNSVAVTEGPQIWFRNNKVFLFYSAGGCWTDGYAVGAISMGIDKDPLDEASWSRLQNNPLFVSNVNGNAFGPGHNSFFKSLDGQEDWILYHANPQSNQGCGSNRTMRMQKIAWDENDLPLLGVPEKLYKELDRPGGE